MDGTPSRALLARHSLRWRLPISISLLLALVLAVLLWAAHREVEATLVRAGRLRAQTAADQIAGLLERSAHQALEEISRAAADSAVAAFVQAPSAETRDRALARLTARTTPGSRRIEVWTDDGVRLLETVTPGSIGMRKPLPPLSGPPARTGLSEFRAAGDVIYSDAVADVTVPSDDMARRLGVAVTRSSIYINPPGILAKLVGEDATILIGNAAGPPWTDLSKVIAPPAVDTTRSGAREYDRAGGDWRLGAVALIRGTPWAVWVEFPRHLITAPARTFLSRMLVTGLIVVLLGAGLVRLVTSRLTVPLGALTKAAESIAGGDYGRRVTLDRRDEIGRLGNAFNAMSAEVLEGRQRLEARIQDRTTALDALRASEQALVESERAYRSTFDEAPVGIAHISTQGQWRLVNRRLADMLGYSREELLAIDPAALTHQDELVEDVDVRARLVAGTLERHLAARRFRHKNGSLLSVNLTVSLHRDTTGQPQYFIAIIEDISERRRLEEQLRQAQKMEAVGRLAGGIAHDFNNLLTAILGYANFVFEDLDPSHPSRRDVEEIRKAGESASSLTRQLLAFSRRQVLQPQVLDLNATVQKMDGLLRRLIGEDISLSSRLSPHLDPVYVDPGQIEQIVLNLAVNARDAMSRGGLLTIETANVTLDEHYVASHPGAAEGPHVMLAVSDNGVGMAPDVMSRVFEPFFTTKPRGEGTGLGLSTVYGIVKQSGGSIWVYSEPGRGTTFKVYFPRARREEERVEIQAPAALLTATGETILVAEDQPEVRALAVKVLRRHGYTVLEARSGVEALQVVNEYPEKIHLLMTDVIMPVMSGRELVAEIHRTRADIRVLYASGYTDDAIVRHGMLDPGLAFLQKPFTPDSLLAKVREVLDK